MRDDDRSVQDRCANDEHEDKDLPEHDPRRKDGFNVACVHCGKGGVKVRALRVSDVFGPGRDR